jgi:hypothetical protein
MKATAPRKLGRYAELPKIINNAVIGSSLIVHIPLLG